MPIIDKDGSLITWEPVEEEIEFDGISFDVVLGSDRVYYAISEREPAFCLSAESHAEAIQQGQKAIESYWNMLLQEEKRQNIMH